MTSIYVKPWFLDKKFSEVAGSGWRMTERGPFNAQRETEKAVLIAVGANSIDGEYSTTFPMWVPKSLTRTEEQFKAEEQSREEKFQKACVYYENLIAYACACGVKGVRKGMRAATIRAKMEAAGVEIPD